MKSNPKARRKRALISNIIFSLIALFALTVAIITLLAYNALQTRDGELQKEYDILYEKSVDVKYTEEEMNSAVESAKAQEDEAISYSILNGIKESIESGNSPYSVFRYLFPNDTVVSANGTFSFFPVNDAIPKNEFSETSFKQDEETGEITYVDDSGKVISKKGIDVSNHNGTIEWDKVAADGVEFVMIRVGYRGSTEGGLVVDGNFKKNIEGALEAGIPVGVYFYTQAINSDEAKEEAEFLIEQIKDYDITYPVAYDIESTDGRTNGMSQEEFTECAASFLKTVADAGYSPMLYGNLKSMFVMTDYESLKDYERWFAYYSFPVYNHYRFRIWQYSDTGTVDGITGNVDMNICMEEYKDRG